MTRVEPPVNQPALNLITDAPDYGAVVYPEAEVYAGAAARGPRAPVPFSPEAVSRRRAAEPPRATGANPARDTNANAPAAYRQPTMPASPAARGRSSFDKLTQHTA